MHFNFTIDLGTVIGVVTMLITIYKLHVSNIKRIQDVESKMQQLLAWYDAWMHSRFTRDRDDWKN